MTINKATQKNIPLLAKCYDNYRLHYKQESNLKETALFIENELTNSKSNFIICFADNKIVGFLRFNEQEFGMTFRTVVTIVDLYIESSYQKNGIAARLITELIKTVKSNKVAWVSVGTSHSNLQALKLYENHGFKKDNETSHFSLKF